MYMMHDHDLPRAQELLRDDQAADGVCGAAAGVADDVGVAFLEAEGAGGVCRSSVYIYADGVISFRKKKKTEEEEKEDGYR